MEKEAQVRAGSTLVRWLDNGRFSLRDANNASQLYFVEDADVPEIIEFLHHWSPAAKAKLRLEVIPPANPRPHIAVNGRSDIA